MVCTCPAARSLSKARSEGAWRENMAKAAMSASAQAISVSPPRESGRRAKSLCTKRKSASADSYFRPCGATMDITPPDIRTSDRFCMGHFRMHLYEKATRISRWLLGLLILRELLTDGQSAHDGLRRAQQTGQ